MAFTLLVRAEPGSTAVPSGSVLLDLGDIQINAAEGQSQSRLVQLDARLVVSHATIYEVVGGVWTLVTTFEKRGGGAPTRIHQRAAQGGGGNGNGRT